RGRRAIRRAARRRRAPHRNRRLRSDGRRAFGLSRWCQRTFTARSLAASKCAAVMLLQHIAIGQIILDNRMPPTTLPVVPPTSNKTISLTSVMMNVQEAIADFLQHGQAVRNLSD